MNLPYIQSEIFRELMGMEPLFKPGCTWFVVRQANQDLEVKLFVLSKDDSWQWDNPRAGQGGYYRYYRRITSARMLAMKTHDDLTSLINSIWHDIPDEYKKTY
jgi:hypothetical protein